MIWSPAAETVVGLAVFSTLSFAGATAGVAVDLAELLGFTVGREVGDALDGDCAG